MIGTHGYKLTANKVDKLTVNNLERSRSEPEIHAGLTPADTRFFFFLLDTMNSPFPDEMPAK